MTGRTDDKDEPIAQPEMHAHNFEAEIVLEKLDQDHEKVFSAFD